MDWKQIVGKLAPTVGLALGGPLGGAAAGLLSQALLGKPSAPEEELAAAIGNATPEQLAEIKKIEANFKIRLRELGLRPEEIAAEDRSSARQREIQTGDRNTPRALAVTALLGFFGVLGYTIIYGLPDGSGGNIVMLLIGTLTAIVTSVYTYYFGSSAGSKAKEQILQQQSSIWR